MDVQEGKDAAKGGVSIFLVVLIIAAIVTVVTLALVWLNKGTSKLGDTVNGVASAQLSQYDGTEMKGDKVMAEIKATAGQGYVMVVDNKTADFDTMTPTGITSHIATNTTDAACYNVGVHCLLSSTGITGAPLLVNCITDGKLYVGDMPDATKPSSATGSLNTAITNTDYAPLTRKTIEGNANANYVAPGTMYYCKLIYDPTTGDACGLCFFKEQ